MSTTKGINDYVLVKTFTKAGICEFMEYSQQPTTAFVSMMTLRIGLTREVLESQWIVTQLHRRV